LDGDVLRLCKQFSKLKNHESPRDVVDKYLAKVATDLKDSQAYERDVENARLVELLKAYRATGGESKAETEALYGALITTMQRLAYAIVKKKNWKAEQNELENHIENIINKVVDTKWSCGTRLLHGWSEEDRGARIVS
jgi:Glu-tRNA(Gln) amidotransferase subunit E-like FAD-binding protein